MRTVLTIAGSDCSGGAGIQADLKTILANNCYGMSVITSLTAQNTTGVYGICDVEPEFLRMQLDAVWGDIYPDAVKIGMVSSEDNIDEIVDFLYRKKAGAIVVDPVMVSTSGSSLLANDAKEALIKRLLPLADIITPNIPEAEVLSGMEIESRDDMEKAGRNIYKEIFRNKEKEAAVLIKGGHSINDANDLLILKDREIWLYGQKINNNNTHGTGCTLSSAIACGMAKGYNIEKSIRLAKKYISSILMSGLKLGKGNGPLDHGYNIAAAEKRVTSEDMRLYAVTDRSINQRLAIELQVEDAIKGGATFIQLRDKELTDEELYDEACLIKTVTDSYRIPFVINDNVEVAKKSGADGVHLGQQDMSIEEARKILGDGKIIGATAHNVEEAVNAEKMGADYLGVGACFGSNTKKDAKAIDHSVLKEICEKTRIPVVGIGGINRANVGELEGTGIDGVAVISGIFAAKNITKAAIELRNEAEKIICLKE